MDGCRIDFHAMNRGSKQPAFIRQYSARSEGSRPKTWLVRKLLFSQQPRPKGRGLRRLASQAGQIETKKLTRRKTELAGRGSPLTMLGMPP